MNFNGKSTAYAVKRRLAAAIAAKIEAGLTLGRMQAELGREEFSQWCPATCEIPLAEAELLIRWSAERPGWADAAAVNLQDPLAAALLDLGMRLLTLHMEIAR
jgi:hypothetical protein